MRRMRGLERPYPCFKRFLSEGDTCFTFTDEGKILELKVLEVVDWTHRCRNATWRTGCVYYFVEQIPNESALGEEIYLTRREAKLAYKRFVSEWLKGIW